MTVSYQITKEVAVSLAQVWPLLSKSQSYTEYCKLVSCYVDFTRLNRLQAQLKDCYQKDTELYQVLQLGSFAHYKDVKSLNQDSVKSALS